MIILSEFPRASELNPVLYDRVCENLQGNVVALHGHGARRTEPNLHGQNIEEIDILISWIKKILPEISKNFATKDTEETIFGYNLHRFEIAECWAIHYNRSESVIEHCHFPYALSFVYYVRTPEGSAPIIIENEAHEIKEGQCIFFLASQYHSVYPKNCDGRCAIVGNILYRF
jgi:hypothetical protein